MFECEERRAVILSFFSSCANYSLFSCLFGCWPNFVRARLISCRQMPRGSSCDFCSWLTTFGQVWIVCCGWQWRGEKAVLFRVFFLVSFGLGHFLIGHILLRLRWIWQLFWTINFFGIFKEIICRKFELRDLCHLLLACSHSMVHV